jgi:hypothetical protein
MNINIFVPGLVWMTAFFAAAGILYFANKQRGMSGELASAKGRLAFGLAIIGASAIPATIEALFSKGQIGFAGLPLAIIGLGMIFWKNVPASEEQSHEFTFREKSTAISLVLIVLLYGVGSASALASGGLTAGITWLVGSAFLMIILVGVSHAILALLHKPELEDERDQIVGLRSSRNGYAILCVGIWFCLFMMLYTPNVPAIAFTVFGIFVLAEIVRMSSFLIYSRFDV